MGWYVIWLPLLMGIVACRRLLAGRSSRQAAPNPIEPDEELAEQLRSLGCAE
jgi:hypothetical protein